MLTDKQIIISALRIYVRHLSLLEPTKIGSETKDRALYLLKDKANIDEYLNFSKNKGNAITLKDFYLKNAEQIGSSSRLANFMFYHGSKFPMDNIDIRQLKTQRNFGPKSANELVNLLDEAGIKYYNYIKS